MQCEHLHTILYNPFFIGVCIGLGIGQCEHAIKRCFRIPCAARANEPPSETFTSQYLVQRFYLHELSRFFFLHRNKSVTIHNFTKYDQSKSPVDNINSTFTTEDICTRTDSEEDPVQPS